MEKLKVLSLSFALGLISTGLCASAAQQNEMQGRVVSITLTKDCPAEGVCAANVGLAGRDGRVVTFHVRPDTEIMRAGKAISLAQLGVGDVVGIPQYDRITTEMRTSRQVYMFE